MKNKLVESFLNDYDEAKKVFKVIVSIPDPHDFYWTEKAAWDCFYDYGDTYEDGGATYFLQVFCNSKKVYSDNIVAVVTWSLNPDFAAGTIGIDTLEDDVYFSDSIINNIIENIPEEYRDLFRKMGKSLIQVEICNALDNI